jgi:serine phosphatase RsbU (regulator of sigma subunit)
VRSAERHSIDGFPEDSTRARSFSVRLRLLGLVVIVLLPWLGLVLYTTADDRKAAIANVNNDAMRLIRIATSSQAAQIEAARQLLAAFARLPQLRKPSAEECSGFLAELLKAYPLYLNFGLVEPDGNIACSARPLPARINVADRSYFRRSLETRAFAIGDYQIGRITQLPTINYAHPVVDATGHVQAIVFAAQSLDWLTAALADIAFPTDAVLVVTDRNGTILARVPQEEGWVGKALAEPHVRAMVSSQRQGGVFQADDAQGVRRLWAHAPLISGAELHATVSVPESVALADIDRRLMRNLVALGLVTVVAASAAWFGARFFILRQVDALVMAAGKLASGELGARAALVGGRSELSLLARAFNAMAATLQSRDRELRVAEERSRAAEVELAVTRAHMDIARQIQRSLLPEDPLTLPLVRFAGRCIPAAAVGGDYFGYFPRGRNGVDSFLGDVSGHGVGAALLMAEARTTFLAERLIASSAGPILAKLNDLLYDDLDRATLFMTACCATFDAASGELCYASAGHPPAILLRSSEQTWQLLNAEGMPLGMARDADFGEARVELHAGDIVAFYSDGMTEARDVTGGLFGRDRLAQMLVEHRLEEPATLIASVLAELKRFSGIDQFDDDVTIVVMKLLEPSPNGFAPAS